MPIQRTIKNIVKNYSDIERKVREATSNDPWGPASHLMAELSDMSYNVMAFTEIMQMLWKRMNEKQQRHWRHIFKALLVMEYLIKTGSEKVATQCRENIHSIETLMDFQFIEDGRDHGHNIRVKAKDIIELLHDPQLLASERVRAINAKERLSEQVTLVASPNVGTSSSAAGVLASPARYSFRRIISGKDPSSQGFNTLNKKTRWQEEEKMLRIMQNPVEDVGIATFPSFSSPLKHSKLKPPPSSSTSSEHPQLTNDLEAARPKTQQQEEEQLQVALAISREEHERESRQKREHDTEMIQQVFQRSQHDSPLLDESQARPPSSLASHTSTTKATDKGVLSTVSNPKSTSSTSSRTGSISKNTWDPITGAKLFELVDTSLSVAPANAPHPWGPTSHSPNNVYSIPTVAFPAMDAWGECTPVTPATPARTLPPLSVTNEVSEVTGSSISQKCNPTTSEPSLFDEFSGLVNLNALSQSSSSSRGTNPFATAMVHSSQMNPFLDPPDKTSDEIFRTDLLTVRSDVSSTLPPLPSRQINVMSSSYSPGIHPSNPWYPSPPPPSNIANLSSLISPQHVISPFQNQASSPHQTATNPFL